MSASLIARLRHGGVWRIGRNALSLGALQAGGSLATMALAAVLTRRVGLAGLNRVLLALTVEAIAVSIVDLGLNTYLTRELARAPDEAESLLGLALPLKLLASVAVAALTATAVGAAFGPARWGIIALAVAALPCEAFLLTVIAWLKSRQEMHTSSAAQLAVRWLFVAGGIACLLAGWDERAVVACWSLASVAGAAWAWAWLRREGVRPRWRLSYAADGALLRESLPFAVTGIAVMLFRRVDLLLLSLFRADAESGAYGAAHRLFEVLTLAPAVVLDALFPEMARRSAAEAGRAALLQAYRLAQRLVLALAGLVMIATLMLAPLLIRVVYGPDALASDGVLLLRLLALALPLTAGYIISGHLLTVLNRQREVTRAMMLAVGVNAVLNLAADASVGLLGCGSHGALQRAGAAGAAAARSAQSARERGRRLGGSRVRNRLAARLMHLSRLLFCGSLVLACLTPSWQHGIFSRWPLGTVSLFGYSYEPGALMLAPLAVGVTWVAALLLGRAWQTWRWPPWWSALPVVGFGVLALARTSFALDAGSAFVTVMSIGFLWTICLYAHTELPVQWLAVTLAVVLAVQGAVALGQAARQGAVGLQVLGESVRPPAEHGAYVIMLAGQRWLRAQGMTPHPNVLGGHMALGILVVSGQALAATSRLTRALLWGCVGLGALALLLSFSRAGLLALAVASLWAGWQLRQTASSTLAAKVRRRVIRAASALAVLVLVGLGVRLAGIGNELEQTSLLQRFEDYRLAWTLIRARPVTGVGAGNYTAALAASMGNETPAGIAGLRTMHSIPVLAGAELGVGGAVLWTIMLIAPALTGMRAAARRGDMALAGISAALAAAFLVSLADVYLYPLMYWLPALLLGSLLGAWSRRWGWGSGAQGRVQAHRLPPASGSVQGGSGHERARA